MPRSTENQVLEKRSTKKIARFVRFSQSSAEQRDQNSVTPFDTKLYRNGDTFGIVLGKE